MSPTDLFEPAHQEVFTLYYDEGSQLGPVATLQGRATAGFRHTHAGQLGPKLYVVLNADGVQYVGYTRTGFAQRLRLGYTRRQRALHGYHGYKWLARPGLLLYIFPLVNQALIAITNPSTGPSPKQFAECIEAELVHCIRQHYGQWPLGQHEIHFHALPDNPVLRQLAIAVAQAMFQQLPALPAMSSGN